MVPTGHRGGPGVPLLWGLLVPHGVTRGHGQAGVVEMGKCPFTAVLKVDEDLVPIWPARPFRA